MNEKKSAEKNGSVPLEKLPTEILVARNRSFEPFIKTFIQSGENISRLDLGALVGVFEVGDRSEDSAYIVNFLASVAKKEYFSNPRRGAVESFEAALHKVNLALAELVKHGNVAWLGSFHGVIGAFEKNGVHFSATGKGSILLLRDGTLSEISEGLASEEASIHPIKTFTEISSGRLLAGDRIVFSSPELLELFTEEDLLKNALRMDEGRFDQFLKTALVNELSMAGTIVMHIKEGSTPEKKSAPRKRESSPAATAISNVFSQAAFEKPKAGTSAPAESNETAGTDRNEYVDSKTGHIYVQGNDPVEPASHPFFERFDLFLHEAGVSIRSSFGTQSKWFRRLRKQLLISLAAAQESVRGSMHDAVGSMKRRIAARKKAAEMKQAELEAARPVVAAAPEAPVPEPQPEPIIIKTPEAPVTHEEKSETLPDESEIPLFIREKLAAFYKKPSDETGSDTMLEVRKEERVRISFSEKTVLAFSSAIETIRPVTRSVSKAAGHGTNSLKKTTKQALRQGHTAYMKLSPKQRIAAAGTVIAALGAAGIISLMPSSEQAPVSPDASDNGTSESAANTPSYMEEKNGRLADTLSTIADRPDAIALAALDGRAYAILADGIADLSDGRSYPLPSGSGAITFSSSMDDLRLIFLYTDQGELYAWSPISKTYAKNALSLPDNASLRGIGTYLTYLYVLDGTDGQIYRFPRADGGFGAATPWLRNTVSIQENARIAVGESIALSRDGSSVQSFFRGRPVRDFESPVTELRVSGIAAREDATAVYALDAAAGRIIAWNQDGNITAQYFSEQLRDARAIAWNEESGELFIAGSSKVFSLKP